MKKVLMVKSVLAIGLMLLWNGAMRAQEGGSPSGNAMGVDTVPAAWEAPASEAPEKGKRITTINEDRGNWYFKKQILQKSRRLYEELRQLVLRVEPSREEFTKKRNEIDATLNDFYQTCGFQSGEIDAKLKMFDEEIKQMEQTPVTSTSPASKEVAPPKTAEKSHIVPAAGAQQSEKKVLAEGERKKLLQELQEKQAQLKTLNDDFNFVRKLDAASVEALATLTKGLEKVRNYEEEAWTSYEKIIDTINDEVAEDLYRVIETDYRNIQAFERYVKEEFTKFFVALGEQIKAQVATCNNQIAALRTKGVELNKKILEEKARAEKARLEEEVRKKKAPVEQSKPTFWARIGGFFSNFWSMIIGSLTSLWSTVSGWFGGAAK